MDPMIPWVMRKALCPAQNPCPHSLDGVVAGEGDEAPEGQREGVEDLGPRIQPSQWVGQLRDLQPNRDPQLYPKDEGPQETEEVVAHGRDVSLEAGDS